MTARMTIRRPDDWHLHVRDGEMLKAVLPYTAKNFGRAPDRPDDDSLGDDEVAEGGHDAELDPELEQGGRHSARDGPERGDI